MATDYQGSASLLHHVLGFGLELRMLVGPLNHGWGDQAFGGGHVAGHGRVFVFLLLLLQILIVAIRIISASSFAVHNRD
jgi:hypothetical protein